jgi:hypothetical protein
LWSHVYQLSYVTSKWKENNDYVHLLTHGLMKRIGRNDWQGKNNEMQNEEKRITMQKKQKQKCSKMLVASSCYNLSHARWALSYGFSLLEWTSTHQHTSHQCMLWFDCGWTSTKLICGFTLVPHSIRNKSYTRDKCKVTPFSTLLSSPNSFWISKHCYLQSNKILLNMGIKC